MLPTSHQAPTIRTAPPVLPVGGVKYASNAASMVLAEGSSGFLAASARLGGQYRDLRRQVGRLGKELAARDAALETSLHDNEALRSTLHAVADVMPCGVLVLGRDGCIMQANPEACRLLHLSLPDLPHYTDVLPEQLPCALASLHGTDGVGEIVLPATAAGDPERKLRVRARCVPANQDGLEMVLILSDLSAGEASGQEREPDRRAAMLAELAATLAHEIRNPLASLELFTELMEEQPERCREWLGHLRAGLRGMAASLNNMLSFHSAGCPSLETVTLGRVLASAAGFVRPLVEQAGLRLTVQGETLPGTVQASEPALQQVILNLVMNAIRHTPAGGITLSLDQPCGTHLRLRISDTGSGIAAEDLRHIFKPGWSAGGERSGLGLAVCRKIAARHDAELTVSSELGRGTTFSLKLPLTSQAAVAAETEIEAVAR